jgi:hypothetical protein
MHIHCDGNVFMCCFQRNYPLGNLLESSIEEIWFGPKADSVRSEVSKGLLPPVCLDGGCPHLVRQRAVADEIPQTLLPKILSIDLPNYHCNIGGNRPTAEHPACLMCERNLPNYKFHSENHLPRILPTLHGLLPSLTTLHIQGVAEAFWKDAIFEVLNQINFDDFKDQITVTTVTNGTVLREQKIDKFLDRCPRTYVSFSIDAATSETYKKIRRIDALNVVVKNLLYFSECRKRFPNLGLRIQNNINLINVSEVKEMVQLAAQAQVDEIEFNPTGGHPVEILPNEQNFQIFSDAQKIAELEAKRLGVKVVFLRPLDMGYSNRENFQQIS